MADLNKSAKEANQQSAQRIIMGVGLLAYAGAVVVIAVTMGDNMSHHLSETIQVAGWVSAGLWALSAIAILGAIHFSAAGPQRWIAWGIWIADIVLAVMHFIVQGFGNTGNPPDWVQAFYQYAWFANTIVLLAGWGAYFSQSPSQKMRDLIAHAYQKHLANILEQADQVVGEDKRLMEEENRQTANDLHRAAQEQIRAQLGVRGGLHPPTILPDIVQPPVKERLPLERGNGQVKEKG